MEEREKAQGGRLVRGNREVCGLDATDTARDACARGHFGVSAARSNLRVCGTVCLFRVRRERVCPSHDGRGEEEKREIKEKQR